MPVRIVNGKRGGGAIKVRLTHKATIKKNLVWNERAGPGVQDVRVVNKGGTPLRITHGAEAGVLV